MIPFDIGEFSIFFRLGMKHLFGFDHILYLVALTASIYGNKFLSIVTMITAFTLGHSITLLLSALQFIPNISHWVEFFIPITIVITAFLNFIFLQKTMHWIFYIITFCFGLIHGMGFAGQVFMLQGKKFSIINHLLAFNAGLEVSQIMLIISISIFSYFLIHFIKMLNQRELKLCLSCLVILPSIQMVIENKPF